MILYFWDLCVLSQRSENINGTCQLRRVQCQCNVSVISNTASWTILSNIVMQLSPSTLSRLEVKETFHCLFTKMSSLKENYRQLYFWRNLIWLISSDDNFCLLLSTFFFQNHLPGVGLSDPRWCRKGSAARTDSERASREFSDRSPVGAGTPHTPAHSPPQPGLRQPSHFAAYLWNSRQNRTCPLVELELWAWQCLNNNWWVSRE